MSLLAHMVEPNQEIMIDIERALYLSTVNTVGELENMLIINATTILTSHLDRDMLINMLIYNMTLQYAIAFKYDILPRDIYQYYLWKNQINIQRQKENY